MQNTNRLDLVRLRCWADPDLGDTRQSMWRHFVKQEARIKKFHESPSFRHWLAGRDTPHIDAIIEEAAETYRRQDTDRHLRGQRHAQIFTQDTAGPEEPGGRQPPAPTRRRRQRRGPFDKPGTATAALLRSADASPSSPEDVPDPPGGHLGDGLTQPGDDQYERLGSSGRRGRSRRPSRSRSRARRVDDPPDTTSPPPDRVPHSDNPSERSRAVDQMTEWGKRLCHWHEQRQAAAQHEEATASGASAASRAEGALV